MYTDTPINALWFGLCELLDRNLPVVPQCYRHTQHTHTCTHTHMHTHTLSLSLLVCTVQRELHRLEECTPQGQQLTKSHIHVKLCTSCFHPFETHITHTHREAEKKVISVWYIHFKDTHNTHRHYIYMHVVNMHARTHTHHTWQYTQAKLQPNARHTHTHTTAKPHSLSNRATSHYNVSTAHYAGMHWSPIHTHMA